MTHELSASARFHVEIDRLAEEYRPTRHSFFARLAVMPQERLTSAVLSELHLRYQAEPHFADCFAHAVEECHEREAVEITSLVLDRRPKLLGHTVEDARTMARALYRLWGTLDEVLDPPGVDVAR
jgi:hypothetical protein